MSNTTADGTRDLVVSRVLNASPAQVWHAWTDHDHVRQWWGPAGFIAPLARMDVREGGTSLVCMRSPDGHELYNTWTYTRVVPGQRLEYVNRFSDDRGNPVDPADVGVPGDVPREVPHVVALEDLRDGRTRLTVRESGYTSEQTVEMSKLGLEQCLDKMAASLEAEASDRAPGSTLPR